MLRVVVVPLIEVITPLFGKLLVPLTVFGVGQSHGFTARAAYFAVVLNFHFRSVFGLCYVSAPVAPDRWAVVDAMVAVAMVVSGPFVFRRASVAGWAFVTLGDPSPGSTREIAVWHEETLVDLLLVIVVRVGTVESKFQFGPINVSYHFS